MNKKITLLLFLFSYSHIMVTNHIESNDPSIYQETATEEKNLSLTLTQRLSIANQLYNLVQKQATLDKQLSAAYAKLRPKNVLTLRQIIGTGIIASLLAGPALTIHYLNKYITPEKYQPIIDKISMGSAALIGGLGAFGVARQGSKSVYDIFMYEREQQAVKLEIERLKKNKNQTEESIKNIKKQYPEFFTTPPLTYDQEKIYKDFIDFYTTNEGIITTQKISTFLAAHQIYSFNYLLDLCKYKKINLILSIATPKRSSSGFQFSGNLALDIAAGVMLAPWFLIAGAIDAVSRESRESKEVTQEKQFKEIDTLTIIIRKLTNLVSA